MEQMSKNLKAILAVIGLLLVALICRLAYIQLVGGPELAEATRQQSLIALEGSNTRGIIYDRSGQALVADQKRFIYIIKENRFDFQTGKLLKELEASQVNSQNQGYYVYSSENYDQKIGKKLIREYQAYILQASARYSEDQTAAHLIGYVNRKDATGAAGLELAFDQQLSVLNRRIYAAADVKGNLLPGRGLIITSDEKNDSYVKEGIRTTIDKDLQRTVEDLIHGKKKDCAVVILDARTGGIAAMACTPSFDPNNVEAYMEDGGDELVNKATQGQYAPGSVFKIVVAAAALEQGIGTDRTFSCGGSVQVGGLTIGCETGGEEGHGQLDFQEAFAQSCNSYFIQLGQEVGADRIAAMAKRFHLGERAMKDYPQESKGHVMTKEERQGAAIGNLSIGQGEMLTTPVQIARMTGIIATGGIDRGVHILMEEEAGEEHVISQDIAREIGGMMESVVSRGTASGLDLTEEDGAPAAAVKTGTAEYGEKEEGRTHGWITGYTPCEEPEYVITVLAEGGSGSEAAGPIYQKILHYLRQSGSYSRPTLA